MAHQKKVSLRGEVSDEPQSIVLETWMPLSHGSDAVAPTQSITPQKSDPVSEVFEEVAPLEFTACEHFEPRCEVSEDSALRSDVTWRAGQKSPGGARWWYEEGPHPPWSACTSAAKPSSARSGRREASPIPSLRAPTPFVGSSRTTGRKFLRDGFVLWDASTKSETPLSQWDLERGLFAIAQPCRSESTASAKAPDYALDVARPQKSSIACMVLPPPQKLTNHASANSLAQLPPVVPSFNGIWVSRANKNLTLANIEDDKVIWASDGSMSRLQYLDEKKQYVSLKLDGVAHNGALTTDGRLLRWSDGDTWCRDEAREWKPRLGTSHGAFAMIAAQGWRTSRPQRVQNGRILNNRKGRFGHLTVQYARDAR